MWRSPLYNKMLICALLSLIALLAYPYLPQRHLHILPSAGIEQYLLADKSKGGTSQASWVSEEQHHLMCDIRTGKITPFCGMQIKLTDKLGEGLNLGHFNRFKLKIYYKGSSKILRFHLRNFDSRFSKVGDPQSEKFQSYSIYANESNHLLEVPFSAIIVADWWLKEYAVKRDYAAVDLANITSVGVDIPGPIAAGEHEIRLDELEFIGPWVSPEQWYLGILLLWIPLLLLLVGWQRRQLHQRLAVDTVRVTEWVTWYNEAAAGAPIGNTGRDPVTGLLDRHGLAITLRQKNPYPTVLAFMDLDNFAPLINNLGRELGNELLRQIGEFISAQLPPEIHLGHWGEDKFMFVCAESTAENAFTLFNNVRLNLAAHEFDLQGEKIAITACITLQYFSSQHAIQNAVENLLQNMVRLKLQGVSLIQQNRPL